ncbi:unnamed protein product [Rhizopus stolonifer]
MMIANNLNDLNLDKSIVEVELKKLIQTSCINLLSSNFKDLCSKIIPEEILRVILDECFLRKENFKSICTEEIKTIISEVFDTLKQYQFDENTFDILNFLDIEKANLTNKRSEKYKVLCISYILRTAFSCMKLV